MKSLERRTWAIRTRQSAYSLLLQINKTISVLPLACTSTQPQLTRELYRVRQKFTPLNVCLTQYPVNYWKLFKQLIDDGHKHNGMFPSLFIVNLLVYWYSHQQATLWLNTQSNSFYRGRARSVYMTISEHRAYLLRYIGTNYFGTCQGPFRNIGSYDFGTL